MKVSSFPIASVDVSFYNCRLLKGQLIQGSQQGADESFQLFKGTPTLPQLMAFPMPNGCEINILTQIGVRYNVFGIFLLNDNGSITDALKESCMRDSHAINLEISKQWLQGKGKWPITWVTFLSVLKEMDMKALAFDIMSSLLGLSLRGKSSPQGRH